MNAWYTGNPDPLIEMFGPVWCASGVLGLDGTGWDHDWVKRWFGLNLENMTLVTKTVTFDRRRGNTPLRDTPPYRPVSMFPDSVAWRPLRGSTFNSWGLSNCGTEAELDMLLANPPEHNFQISFMPVCDLPRENKDEPSQAELAAERQDRLSQTRKFVNSLKVRLPLFKVKVGVQFNASCPNTGHDLTDFLSELWAHLDILGELGIPVVIKESLDTPFEPMREAVEHPACSGLATTNCPKFGVMPEVFPWQKLARWNGESPLAKYGGGGLSGKHLYRPMMKRVLRYKTSGVKKHIHAIGGIRSVGQVREVLALADSFAIGTVVNDLPWRTGGMIAEGHKIALAA